MEGKIICRVLTGPTGSGKTDYSIRLAEKAGWEIICMDSMQIYRRMDIGTAKPTKEERISVPHHMVDIREPEETYSVAEYVEETESLIRKLHREGKEVLLVGGTVLYLQALVHPFSMGQIPANEPLRKELNEAAAMPGGKETLHRRLEKCDPETATRLPVNDVRRVIRAIEVSETTGIPFSQQPDRSSGSPFEWRIAATLTDRKRLYHRINERVTAMIRNGLEEEVRSLLLEGVPESAQSMCGLGYKEMIPYIHGECSLDCAAEHIRTGSRHYAKRQITFMKKLPEVNYIDTQQEDAFDRMLRILA